MVCARGSFTGPCYNASPNTESIDPGVPRCCNVFVRRDETLRVAQGDIWPNGETLHCAQGDKRLRSG